MTPTTLTPYPAYKDSGVPWLGAVPEHWQVQRLKTVATLNPSKSEAGGLLKPETPVAFLPMERVGTEGSIDTRSIVPAERVWSGFTYFRRNDVIVAKITPCFENGKGAYLCNLPTEMGFGSTEFHVLRARAQILPAFLYRVTTVSELRKLGADQMTGAAGQQRVPESFVATLPIPIPPPSEQAAIVRYLDHVDRRIRRYVRAKQRLIKLLEEQKQAIIHQAVTRGLDPAVRLKPSGVEWLGDVPEHWHIVRIKNLLRETDTRSSTGREVLLSLRMKQGLVPHDEHFAKPGQASTLVGYKLVRPGQVIMNRLQANNGLVFASDIHGVISPDYAIFDPVQDVNLQYLTALFRTPLFKHKFRIESKGLGTGTAGFLRLYTDRFGAIPIAIPDVDEQCRIMAWLEEHLAGLENSTKQVERQISLLREYRTRLIADVVTGKLDVRAAAAALPGKAEAADLDAALEAGLDEAGELDELEDTAEADAAGEADAALLGEGEDA